MSNETTKSEGWELVTYKLGQMELHLGRLDERLDELFKLVLNVPKCSRPGLCISLDETIKQLKENQVELFSRVNALEKDVSYANGFGKGAMVLISMASGLVGSIVVMLLKSLIK